MGLFFIILLFQSYALCGHFLTIGVLRHLSIEDARDRNIDFQAEFMLLAEARRRGHYIEFINPLTFMCSTESRPIYDVIISRAEIETFSESSTEAYLRVLDYFKELHIPVINSSTATLRAQDKFRTLICAHNNGILIPRSFLLYKQEDIRHMLDTGLIRFPFFLKAPYGGRGRGVFRIDDLKSLCERLTNNFCTFDPILIQDSIDLTTDVNGNVRDIRAWVVRSALDNKAQYIGGVYRVATKGQYLTNTCAGGTVAPLTLPLSSLEEIAKISENALDSIEADVAGIDLAQDKEGNIYLLEINISFETGKVYQDLIQKNIWQLVIDLAEARVAATAK